MILLSDDIRKFISEHEKDDIKLLALQAKRYSNIDIQDAIQQIRGRQIARYKIPSWYSIQDIIYPKQISLEQSSSEYTARYKAELCDKGDSFVDLTGGMGIDFFFMSQKFTKATYVEQNEELVTIATHNKEVLKAYNTHIVHEDSVSYLHKIEHTDTIYIDPARRDATGKKTVRIEDCTPNIIDIESILDVKANRTIIKLSPMLDISLAIKSLKNISDVHIVSHNNECKELLFIKNKKFAPLKLHCVNITNENIDKYSFCLETEHSLTIPYTSEIGNYLYEPNSSIIKAGAYKSITNEFSPINKLHSSSHLYTSDTLHTNFQGRKFQVISTTSLNKKELKKHLVNIDKANITVRNFPLTPDELRKKIGLKDGGDIYIFATTLADERKVLILCNKIQ